MRFDVEGVRGSTFRLRSAIHPLSVVIPASSGSAFNIFLPRVKEGDGYIEPRKAKVSTSKGSETILVVEDDDLVRQMVRRTLETRGYRVLEASSGAEGIGICQQDRSIGLVIADLVMRPIGGLELGEHLASLRPKIKILYMSGYVDDEMLRDVFDMPFLQKPFTPDDLVAKVREVLG